MENTKTMRYCYMLICTMFALSLNAQQWYFFIEEHQPAQQPLLQEAQQVLWVNNTVPQPSTFGHSEATDGNVTGNVPVMIDEAPLHCLFAATQTMNESGEYMRVEMLEQSQNPSTNYYTRQLMTNNELQELCQTYKVEALVVLNQLILYDIVESFLTDNGLYYAYMQACAQSHWSVYNAQKNSISSFVYADTLLWESDERSVRNQAVEQLPTRSEALLYLAREIGGKVATSLTPQWVEVKRYLYDYKHAPLQAGLDAFRQQRWEDAIQMWQVVIESSDKKAAAAAAANSAVAYELLNDYASASSCAEIALHLFGEWKTAYGRQQQVNIRYYLANLQERQAREGDR